MKTIDLAGPEGNAYALMGYAKEWGKQLGKNTDDIINRMKSDDYENLVNVFVEEFQDVCEVYTVKGDLWTLDG